MVLPGVEVAVRAMVRRWQCELSDVQQKYGFELVEDTMRWLEEQVDAAGGGACAVADGRRLVGCSREADREAAARSLDSGVANGLSRVLVCCTMRVLVARWCAAVSKARERTALPLGELVVTKRARRERRARAMALARLIGSVQLVVARLSLYGRATMNWRTAVSRHRSVLAKALMAAFVPADGSLCRRVWLRLVGNFDMYTVSCRGVDHIARFAEKSRRHEAAVDNRAGYDWTCTQCGWGGHLVRAGHFTCSKCEWQCLCWCGAVARIDVDDEELVERLVGQRPKGRRVAARVQRRLGDGLWRLQGGQVGQQGSRQMVGLKQTGRTGGGAAAGGQDGGFQPP
jgi:hypothetical protein